MRRSTCSGQHWPPQSLRVSVKTSLLLKNKLASLISESKYHWGRRTSITISIRYWQRYWVVKGTKTTGQDHRMIIFRFPGRPCGFRGARSKKPLKKSPNLSKMTKFLMFFVSSCFKTTWLTLKPINQHSVVPSNCFNTQFVPRTASIVEISLNLSIFWPFLDHSASWRIFFTS
mgnify:CR=1 FL=1